jgi:thiol-disulfide isomerase/thioredoxin
MGCIAIKPIVDGIEREFEGELKVIRINIQSDLGRDLRDPYQFQYTPSFIYLNGQGIEEWRQIGGLDSNKLRASLRE